MYSFSFNLALHIPKKKKMTASGFKTLLEHLNNELQTISKYTNIKINGRSLLDGLRCIATQSKEATKISESQREQIYQKLRLFTVLLKDPKLSLSCEYEKDKVFDEDARELIKKINAQCGVVPAAINKEYIELPDDKYLPVQMRSEHALASATQSNTLDRWKLTPWFNPARNKEKEAIKFIEGFQTSASAAREQLCYDAIKTNDSDLNSNRLSFADAKFFEKGLLDADHMQSSSEILSRQLEMIDALNVSIHFKEELEKEIGACGSFELDKEGNHCHVTSGNGYFLIERNSKQLYGTQYFFMLFHNCINNLWLLSHHLNSGTGKSNKEALEWLQANPFFGDNFFNYIGGKDNIEKETLLFSLKSPPNNTNTLLKPKMLIAQVAKIYFENTYQDLIKNEQLINQLSNAARNSFHQAIELSSRRRKYEHFCNIIIASTVLDDKFSERRKEIIHNLHDRREEGHKIIKKRKREVEAKADQKSSKLQRGSSDIDTFSNLHATSYSDDFTFTRSNTSIQSDISNQTDMGHNHNEEDISEAIENNDSEAAQLLAESLRTIHRLSKDQTSAKYIEFEPGIQVKQKIRKLYHDSLELVGLEAEKKLEESKQFKLPEEIVQASILLGKGYKNYKKAINHDINNAETADDVEEFLSSDSDRDNELTDEKGEASSKVEVRL